MDKKNTLINLIYGNDDYLVDRRAYLILSNLCREQSQPEVFSFTGNSTNDFVKFIYNIVDSINTISLFDSSKIIWLKGLSCFSDLPYTKSEQAQQAIELLLTTLAKQVDNIIVISLNNPDKRLRHFKTLLNLGNSEEIVSNKKEISTSDLTDFCNMNSIKFDSNDAIDLFKNKIGPNSRLAEQEINKLAAYIYPKKIITIEDINAITTDDNTGEFFDQLETIFSKDTSKIINMLDKYFWNNNEARPLLYAIQNRVRLLIQLRALHEEGLVSKYISAQDLTSIQNKLDINFETKSSFNALSQNPWYLGKLLNNSLQFSLKKLIKFQIECADSFIHLALNYNDQASVLKNLILNLVYEV